MEIMKLAEKLDEQKKQNRAYVEVRPLFHLYFPSRVPILLSLPSLAPPHPSSSNFDKARVARN
jgi:hypothetical protein